MRQIILNIDSEDGPDTPPCPPNMYTPTATNQPSCKMKFYLKSIFVETVHPRRMNIFLFGNVNLNPTICFCLPAVFYEKPSHYDTNILSCNKVGRKNCILADKNKISEN